MKKMVNLTENARIVLEARYLKKNDKGKVIETPEQMFRRVAKAVSLPDKKYRQNPKKAEKEFYELMSELKFLPNSPTLMNAGTEKQMLSACFVLPVEDSLESIFTTLKNMALIEQVGGGVGFNFSALRAKGAMVGSTHGTASGPVSFMKIYDAATEEIKQGSRRRGAMMGILNVNHLDIIEFITAKNKENILKNFNLSIAVTDSFMKNAGNSKIFRLIAENAWKTGDPGLVFIDEINRKHPIKAKISSTNPCVTGYCWVMTSNGPALVRDLIGKDCSFFVNGFTYNSKGFFKTGEKKVYKLVTKEGFEIEATGDHKVMSADKVTRDKIYTSWKELCLLKKGNKIMLNNCSKIKRWGGRFSEDEGYILGLLVSDGYITEDHTALCCWKTDKGYEGIKNKAEKIMKQMPHRADFIGWGLDYKGERYRLKSAGLRQLAKTAGMDKSKNISCQMEMASFDFYSGFLRGFFDTDGSVQGTQQKGVSIRLAQSNVNRLNAVQRMLLRMGIYSKIYKFRREATTKKMPDGHGGQKEYAVKAQHELTISGENVKRFYDIIGFSHTGKNRKLKELIQHYKRKLNKERFIAEIKEILPSGTKPVFDATVNALHAFDANGFIVHNCGEVPLLPYESCNLGSINLSRFVKNNKVDWEELKLIVHTTVHFLDNVIDANKFPIKETEEITKANRKIGLGVMGFAEMLIQLNIAYDSDEAVAFAEKLMNFIRLEAENASFELAKRRGIFPNFKKSKLKRKQRNATVTSIAPTGTISIIAGTSSGIEPLFAISFVREVLGGKKLPETNRLFEKIAKERGFYSKQLMKQIAKTGRVSDAGIPEDVKTLFVTAFEIDPVWHVRMQAVFQKHIDNAVSKTVNLPESASIADVKRVYLLAHKLKCKGITIYRYGSKPEQVLYIGGGNVKAHAEYSGGCATGECSF